MQKRHLAAQLLSRKGVDRESVLAQLESYPDELEVISLGEMAKALEKSVIAISNRVALLRKRGVQIGIKTGKRYHNIYTNEDFQKVKDSYEKNYIYPSNAAAQRPDVLGAPQ